MIGRLYERLSRGPSKRKTKLDSSLALSAHPWLKYQLDYWSENNASIVDQGISVGYQAPMEHPSKWYQYPIGSGPITNLTPTKQRLLVSGLAGYQRAATLVRNTPLLGPHPNGLFKFINQSRPKYSHASHYCWWLPETAKCQGGWTTIGQFSRRADLR